MCVCASRSYSINDVNGLTQYVDMSSWINFQSGYKIHMKVTSRES